MLYVGKALGILGNVSGVRPCWDLSTVCLPMKRLAGGITKANVCTVPLGESGVCHCRSGSWRQGVAAQEAEPESRFVVDRQHSQLVKLVVAPIAGS